MLLIDDLLLLRCPSEIKLFATGIFCLNFKESKILTPDESTRLRNSEKPFSSCSDFCKESTSINTRSDF